MDTNKLTPYLAAADVLSRFPPTPTGDNDTIIVYALQAIFSKYGLSASGIADDLIEYFTAILNELEENITHTSEFLGAASPGFAVIIKLMAHDLEAAIRELENKDDDQQD